MSCIVIGSLHPYTNKKLVYSNLEKKTYSTALYITVVIVVVVVVHGCDVSIAIIVVGGVVVAKKVISKYKINKTRRHTKFNLTTVSHHHR